MKRTNIFHCEACHKTFPRAWTEEESQEEYKKLWPDAFKANEETAVVCDDCFKKGMVKLQ